MVTIIKALIPAVSCLRIVNTMETKTVVTENKTKNFGHFRESEKSILIEAFLWIYFTFPTSTG